MADTFTTHYNFDKPQVGADAATWGGILNANYDLLDTVIFNGLSASLPLAGGILSGVLQTLDVRPADNSTRKLGSSTKVWSDVFSQNIDFYSCVATPVLNCTFLSSGTGLVLKFATPTGQAFAVQNSAAVAKFSVDYTGAATFAAIVTALDFTATSDRNLKTNIQPIDDALRRLSLLHGVRFNWKESGDAAAGVIAQEAIAALPESVSSSEAGLTVHPMAVIGLLVAALNELHAEVAALRMGR